MPFSLFPLLSLLLLILPLGLDTLGVSLSLGIKSTWQAQAAVQTAGRSLPPWLRTAILFSLAEMLMPILGLLIGAALASRLSETMHYLGALLLIGLGLWELVSEGREYLEKRRRRAQQAVSGPTQARDNANTQAQSGVGADRGKPERFRWGPQLLLALSISLDELAVGFSFGSLKHLPVGPLAMLLGIGLQGFLMTLIGLLLGRALSFRLKPLQEVSELLSGMVLIGLGIWFLFIQR
jgi:manganese efflux pump family protein